MEKKTRKKILVILMIITILATDFLVLSTGIKTYASQLNSETNNENIEFSVYFKDGENRVDSVEKSIRTDDLKLYAEIKVKKEGYLKEGTVIELENNNFNLKSEILPTNTHIKSIEGNKVNLKQINSEETVEIELGIEPVITEKIEPEFLSQTTTVKMIGVYVYSKAEEGISVRTDKWVSVNYQPDEETQAEMETKIITNKVLSIDGKNQRLIQQLVRTRIVDNEYPIEKTIIKAQIPELSGNKPEVEAIEINKVTKIGDIKTENGTLEITLTNEADSNNQISWNKNVYDEIVISYIYPEDVEVDKSEIVTDAEIKLYNSKKSYTLNNKLAIENEESNNVIMGRTQITTEELYKGKIYANIGEQYNTYTTMIVTKANIADKVEIIEGADYFVTEEKELSANTKYIETEINLEQMMQILGQDGWIEIKSGETTITINKDTQVNENGDVIVKYVNGAKELSISTSAPVNKGLLKLEHTKAIIQNDYTRIQLQKVNELKTKTITTAVLGEQKILENSAEPAVLKLNETMSKAELSIENNKKSLSTTETNEMTLGVTLITNGTQYDLYKNPKISIKFPEAVENVELVTDINKQNANEFTIKNGGYNKSNRTLQINLQGEQTSYPESDLTQSYIQLNLKISLNSLAIAQNDKIMMAYTNENAIQYYSGTDYGVTEQEIEISAPSQLIKKFNLTSNENTSLTDTVLQKVKENEVGKELNFEISLINNKDSNIKNLKILGKLPTTDNVISGQEANTLETTLKGISAGNATVYYTENSKATVDVNNKENGWSTNLNSNAKLYLIQVEELERGANYTANLTIEPKDINGNELSYTQYGVIYDTISETEVKESSRKIGLATSDAATIKTEITAQVGADVLENGDTVKEGEVIKYTVTVTNNGVNTLENLQLKLDVPEGTSYVRPIPEIVDEDGNIIQDGYVYADGYYEEVTDENQLEELTNILISQLPIKEPYTIEYEVRVNKGSANTEILNQSVVIYDSTEIGNIEFKNSVQEANVRVTIKRATDESINSYPGGKGCYKIYVENLANETLNNLEMKVLSDKFVINRVDKVIDGNEVTIYEENVPETIIIDEISANSKETFYIEGTIDRDIQEMLISAIVKDNYKNTYRSNELKEDLPNIDVEINMSSNRDKEYIKQDDIIEYTIIAQNMENIDTEIAIIDEIPDILQIQSVYINEQLKKQTTNEEDTNTYVETINNYIYETTILGAKETFEVKILAKVGYVPSMYHGKTITNRAELMTFNVLEDSSKVITHVLKSNEVSNENVENIISGIAWFDENENGKLDAGEERLSGIVVKLYDISTNDYVRDRESNIIQTITDNDGEYNFSQIKDGSYLIVFEYDSEKYVLTIANAENVDSSISSKASIKKINWDTYIERVGAIEINKLDRNVFDMNIGLKENIGETPSEEQPGIEEIPVEPDEPENPDDPNEPDIPEEPDDDNTGDNSEDEEKPGVTQETKLISGYIWLDSNANGRKDNSENYLSGIKVRVYDVLNKEYIKNDNGEILVILTDDNGKYEVSNINKGSYILVFEYNAEEFKLGSQNSNIVAKELNINGQNITAIVTDTIKVQDNIYNVNVGLQENLKFDLELDKYISKIIVQTSKETKTYNYNEKTLGKVEIHRKQVQGANVVLEYTIKIKNNGEIAGYAKNIVDYLPSGLMFSSELNKDWYISGNYLYTKSLENTVINPGEEKEVKLILTKTMTSENVGLINNTAEIYQDYNQFGESDIDSTPNNQNQNEDDFGSTDVIIQIATGGSIIAYIVLIFINIVLIFIALKIMMMNEIIKVKTKEERR